MSECLPDDLREYLRGKKCISGEQRVVITDLAMDSQDRRLAPAELAARYVRRRLKSGWFRGVDTDAG